VEIFRWNEWNRDHATRHGCTIEEIQWVVRNAGRGFPRYIGDDKYEVEGRGIGGRMVRVIFIRSPRPVVYVIHAMLLTTRRRRR
jgi:hypothetical protein